MKIYKFEIPGQIGIRYENCTCLKIQKTKTIKQLTATL